ncbi:DUF4123 domain-containing protein [Xanthomonas oryzae]|uniref:DUF4123 domain-containing protein n=1 Tax=Xanthomonas oryzae TaxID=347 RepID=UPI0011F287D8|nr:DUF4123 domain-containing protein [Xanthomonas oryzae]QEO98569.1 hypothetical protein XOCgx_3580 [Xanthomonas oryzae pv. oryzicola]UBB92270.1 DUF4123 domain-containing protein [Xanthomonas oryzae pv. oryzicola]WGY43530.1 DUF4123 domain-containing protein [Xanthomonas oryzae pv. oryzicola]
MDVNERLYALARQAGGARRYLLMQTTDAADAAGDRFQQMLAEVGLAPMPVKIHKLPSPLWPVLIALDLDQGTHSALSALAVDMAIADTAPQAMEHGQIQRTCAWIFSNAPVGELARHLATTAIARHLPSHKARWLRYYDPLVADLFWQACAPEQLAYFLRDIACLAYIDRWQTLQVVRPPDSCVPAAALPATAWERLDGIGALNQAWARARCAGMDIAPAQFSAAAAAVQHGCRQGVRPGPGLDLFAWQAVHLGPGFYRHRQVQALLDQVSAGEDYTELANQVDDAHWQGIAMETGNFLAPSTQERMTP